MNTNILISTSAGLLLMMATSLAGAQAPERPAGQQVPAKPPADAIFNALDTSKDGTLSRQEFQAGYPGLARVIVLELRLREQFVALDGDRSGTIEAGEYANLELVRRAGKSAPVLTGFDANKNRKLEFAEYVAAVRQLAALTTPEKK